MFTQLNGNRIARNLGALMLMAFCVGPIYAQEFSCKLPAQLNRTIDEHWHGWRVMQLSDLNPDDEQLWSKTWGNLCPGIASGHFLSLSEICYAISLINSKNREQAIILAEPKAHGNFSLQIISPPEVVSNFAVVHTLPLGTYTEVENGPTVTTKLDSIAVETIEAAMTMFYAEHGSFHSLELSE